MKKLTDEEKLHINYAIYMVHNLIEKKHRLIRNENYEKTLEIDRQFETLSFLLQHFLDSVDYD